MRAVVVAVGRLGAVDADGAELFAALEALLKHRAGQHVAQLGLDDRRLPRELDVFDGDDRHELPIHLEHRPVAKIVGRNHCVVLIRNSSASSYPVKPRPVITPRAARAVTLRERNSSRAWMFERWTSTTGTASACKQS